MASIWSDLDRVRWRGGETTLERTSELCGRVYRKFLTREDAPVEIVLKLARKAADGVLELQGDPRNCLPNDPLFLMVQVDPIIRTAVRLK